MRKYRSTLRTRERAANRELARTVGIPATVKHGLSCYQNWGCRCEVCSDAASVARRARTVAAKAAREAGAA